ncbi:hypothetical protein CBR_g40195 [Chara braunii]|uniref:F-box domain-containing protein n=1 Tax=Chara braunii TaxID=69332 RepID=A0A388LTC1_CHABU|nr:hypothetical protein CBR_g40195 [Chara braunii]|eukprot:GBG85557.1 hypothetical protein CBR_g40195 [Chara braunii]
MDAEEPYIAGQEDEYEIMRLSDPDLAPALPCSSECSLSSLLPPSLQIDPAQFLRLGLSDTVGSPKKANVEPSMMISSLRKSTLRTGPLSPLATGKGNQPPADVDPSSPGWLILTLVLPYLDLRTLVSLESVSKGIRNAVLEDPALWCVLEAASHAERKMDDRIFRVLVARSKSRLTKARMSFCLGLTGAGIANALAKCVDLQCLSLRSCRHVEGRDIVQLVKSLADQNRACGRPPVLKSLRIAGCKNVTAEHVRELKALLQAAAAVGDEANGEAGTDAKRGPFREQTRAEPLPFYYNTIPDSKDDKRLLDLDICPRCSRILEVYSCTRPECASAPRQLGPHAGGRQSTPPRWPTCRACKFCIERCRECGGCCEDGTWTVCGCDVCEECWFNLEKCRRCNKGWCRRHAEDEDGELICVDCKDRSFRYMMTRFYDS